MPMTKQEIPKNKYLQTVKNKNLPIVFVRLIRQVKSPSWINLCFVKSKS